MCVCFVFVEEEELKRWEEELSGRKRENDLRKNIYRIYKVGAALFFSCRRRKTGKDWTGRPPIGRTCLPQHAGGWKGKEMGKEMNVE